MENINNTTLILSMQSFTSSTPWFTSNQTSSSWGTSQPAQGVLTRWLFEKVLFLSLMVVQCALLHPQFQHSSSARLTRLSLGPPIIGWWLCYPFRLPLLPFQDRNIFPGFLAAIMVFKSLEWAFSPGPYHIRTLKIVDGTPVWEKESTTKIAPENSQSNNLADFALWTTLQFTSQRGFRWSWGPAGKGNENSFLQALLEIVRLQLVLLPCLGFVLYSQDWDSYDFDPRKPLLSLGVPSFRGLGLLAGGIHSACTMFVISCSIEMISALPVLSTYLLYPAAKRIGLPSKLVELANPANFPPQFGSLFELSSLAHFWGKSWHQKFRRPFLFCGGKPAMSLARALGGSANVQKISGVMGVFALSGLFHEYPMYAFQRAPHPYPRALFETLPASFLFFFLQSFGVILEPLIIPYVPRRLGGAKLWTAAFLLLTAPLFTRDICRPAGMFNQYRPPHMWTWMDVVIPVPIAARMLSDK
ncbi:hypothetical protein PGTUg99_029512 [Puccinia graminis f. sp. tritici]|uniref:Wax synthase domain-containing protein n=1 Tax=Puccinia graminis f. sp. tritici TaxID=56615 RepID=A0A5B0SH95_PUCGR|nr:hypothetical protein PGTUg99_029512 [Puccinia graminis f. sp. tritici]